MDRTFEINENGKVFFVSPLKQGYGVFDYRKKLMAMARNRECAIEKAKKMIKKEG